MIEKLSVEGHEVEATDTLAKAYLHIATNNYDIIIIDAENDPTEIDMLCKWIAEKRLDAEVVQLTHWRETREVL